MHNNFLGRQADYVLEGLTAPADYCLPPPMCVGCSKTYCCFSFCFSFVFILILYFVYDVDNNNNKGSIFIVKRVLGENFGVAHALYHVTLSRVVQN